MTTALIKFPGPIKQLLLPLGLTRRLWALLFPWTTCTIVFPREYLSKMGRLKYFECLGIFLRFDRVGFVFEIRFVRKVTLLQAKLEYIRSALLQCKERLAFPYSLLVFLW